MDPRVSVVIPVFNRPVAVRRAIDSVLAQTFQRFEIIVVDDGSTDASAASVSEIADRRIRLIRHERNRGGSAARNAGIQASSAPYIAFLDSDDEWLPTKLERQLEVFARSGERLALVYTGSEWVYPDGTVIVRTPSDRPALSLDLLTENVVGETSVGMVRRAALEAVGGFDETLPSCQDMDLWLRIAKRFDVGIVAEALVRVTKGEQDDRITNNVRSALDGRALFCQKHQPELIRRRVLFLYLRKSGWWEHRRVRDITAARRFYRESIEANHFAPLTYVLLLSTYVPMRWLDALARCKQVLFAVFHWSPGGYPARNSYRPSSTSTQ